MKSMLYVGATLMIGASIYGFVDYKQTHNKKAFREMYASEKKTVPATTPVTEKLAPVTAQKNEPVSPKKPVIRSSAGNPKEDPTPSLQPVSAAEKTSGISKQINAEPVIAPEPAKETKVVKKKKIRKEYFSRGRIPEEEVVIEPAKKESK